MIKLKAELDKVPLSEKSEALHKVAKYVRNKVLDQAPFDFIITQIEHDLATKNFKSVQEETTFLQKLLDDIPAYETTSLKTKGGLSQYIQTLTNLIDSAQKLESFYAHSSLFAIQEALELMPIQTDLKKYFLTKASFILMDEHSEDSLLQIIRTSPLSISDQLELFTNLRNLDLIEKYKLTDAIMQIHLGKSLTEEAQRQLQERIRAEFSQAGEAEASLINEVMTKINKVFTKSLAVKKWSEDTQKGPESWKMKLQTFQTALGEVEKDFYNRSLIPLLKRTADLIFPGDDPNLKTQRNRFLVQHYGDPLDTYAELKKIPDLLEKRERYLTQLKEAKYYTEFKMDRQATEKFYNDQLKGMALGKKGNILENLKGQVNKLGRENLLIASKLRGVRNALLDGLVDLTFKEGLQKSGAPSTPEEKDQYKSQKLEDIKDISLVDQVAALVQELDTLETKIEEQKTIKARGLSQVQTDLIDELIQLKFPQSLATDLAPHEENLITAYENALTAQLQQEYGDDPEKSLEFLKTLKLTTQKENFIQKIVELEFEGLLQKIEETESYNVILDNAYKFSQIIEKSVNEFSDDLQAQVNFAEIYYTQTKQEHAHLKAQKNDLMMLVRGAIYKLTGDPEPTEHDFSDGVSQFLSRVNQELEETLPELYDQQISALSLMLGHLTNSSTNEDTKLNFLSWLYQEFPPEDLETTLVDEQETRFAKKLEKQEEERETLSRELQTQGLSKPSSEEMEKMFAAPKSNLGAPQVQGTVERGRVKSVTDMPEDSDWREEPGYRDLITPPSAQSDLEENDVIGYQQFFSQAQRGESSLGASSGGKVIGKLDLKSAQEAADQAQGDFTKAILALKKAPEHELSETVQKALVYPKSLSKSLSKEKIRGEEIQKAKEQLEKESLFDLIQANILKRRASLKDDVDDDNL